MLNAEVRSATRACDRQPWSISLPAASGRLGFYGSGSSVSCQAQRAPSSSETRWMLYTPISAAIGLYSASGWNARFR
jgi:hypothetical protein